MTFLATEVIKKKRLGLENSPEEITELISLYTKDKLPDYQMAAWLMAATLNGLSKTETACLVKFMLHSGIVLDFSHLNSAKIDKHSTGGVGDKTSMILAPIVACSGIYVPMMAGRGLGHTGGTLDKLESIPGFETRISIEQYKKQISDIGVSIMGQTEEICPADKRLYSLRDVTSTIPSLGLITASIMSKKLAEGVDGIVFDVKTGSGAFMKELEDAKTLAKSLGNVGKEYGKKVVAIVSDMNQPLGRFVGNSLEIEECIAILNRQNHEHFRDCVDLSLRLSAYMIYIGNKADNVEQAYEMAQSYISSGQAFEKFKEIIQHQGGDLSKLPKAKYKKSLSLDKSGYIKKIHNEKVGIAGILLGAGRTQITDDLDPTAGFEFHYKIGDKYEKGQNLISIYANSETKIDEVMEYLQQSIILDDEPTQAPPLIYDEIKFL